MAEKAYVSDWAGLESGSELLGLYGLDSDCGDRQGRDLRDWVTEVHAGRVTKSGSAKNGRGPSGENLGICLGQKLISRVTAATVLYCLFNSIPATALLCRKETQATFPELEKLVCNQ